MSNQATPSRRGLLVKLGVLSNACVAALLAVPIGRYLLSSITRGRPLREEFGCTHVDSHGSTGIKAGRFGGAHGCGVQQDVGIRIR